MKELPFARSEFDRRLTLVRNRMAERDIDALLVNGPENIYYLSGYHTPGIFAYQVFIVPRVGEPLLLVRRLARQIAETTAWTDRIVTYLDHQDPIGVTRSLLAELGLQAGRVGVEENAWFLTYAQVTALKAALAEAEVVNGSGLVERVRLIKSEPELAYIREATRITEVGLRAGIEACTEGRTEDEVAAAMTEALILNGSEYPGHMPLVGTGPRSAMGHADWSGRRLERGDIVFLEPGASVHRYHAALMHSVAIGAPSAHHQRMMEVSVAAMGAAVAAIRPGATSAEVDAACRRPVEEAGMGSYYEHRTAYSIGIAFPPDWSEGRTLSLREGDPTPLESGMVFHVFPFLADPGRAGIVASEMVLVTDDGCEVLSHVEPELFVR